MLTKAFFQKKLKIHNGAPKMKKLFLSILARYSKFKIMIYVKTGIYVKDEPFFFQNIETELKYLI